MLVDQPATSSEKSFVYNSHTTWSLITDAMDTTATEDILTPPMQSSRLEPAQQDWSEIELLKSRVAELERKFGQLMAELEILQQTIGQINQQVERLENEILAQVGWSIQIYKLTKA